MLTDKWSDFYRITIKRNRIGKREGEEKEEEERRKGGGKKYIEHMFIYGTFQLLSLSHKL